jgi:peptidoglycan/LPS O-acetylase OafA/YrhL
MERTYLPNLDGLRAVSVLLVILGHATSLQLYFGGYQFKDWLWIPGKFGVVMFFCISGILISYLLDQERDRDGDINIKRFYIRRAARIWPLYFMVVIPGIALNLALSGTSLHTEMGFLDYFFMAAILPGFADRPMFIGPTWSIGIEESFYAVYPLMVRYMTRRTLAATLFAITFSPEIFGLLGRYTCPGSLCSVRFWWSPEWYACIAIGCLTYQIYSAKIDWLNRLMFSPAVQCIAFCAVAVTTSAAVFAEKFFAYRIDAVIFSVVAINAALNPGSILQIRSRLMNYIGKISYGMYMLHVYCVCAALMICWLFFKGDTFPYQNLIVSMLTLTFTIVVAKLSYDYVENPIRSLARRTEAASDLAQLLDAHPTQRTVF